MTWIGKIGRVGRMVEPAPDAPEATVAPPTGVTGSLQLRHLDAGSCNGCELEIASTFSPVYDAEQYGARLVASPRHADGLLATGVVTQNMRQPLVNTLGSVPEPRVVIAVGDCACTGGVFRGGYGVVGAIGDVVPVDVEVPGCPPTPQQIIAALRSVTGR
ncbi:NADH-quinone oxidoreductase subunit B family protein [Pengzhenrongella sicca]|uniref:Oxidoreductase n=1 Tax=Pengzhenrongella sicca TaxID=2819238 RepID=A0A8A4ZFH4_9MICO|nr:oxidoreductase [Pengzhenrongella sicca]QTE30752.1 oxidoreductase [Pengzhenrongella sicca]